MKITKNHGHIALLVANIIFGLNNPISRSLIPDVISSFAVIYYRFLGGAILFWGASLFIEKIHIPISDILKLFLASIFGLLLNQIPLLFGLSLTSPINATLVITLLPIITMIMAAIIIKEPITWLKIWGVIIGASGVLILILNSTSTHTLGNYRGDLIILISTCSFAFYLTMFKNIISKYPPIHTMKWMFLFASIVSFPICKQALSQISFFELDRMIYIKIGYIVVLATFVAYFLVPIGQKTLRPTTLSMYNYVQPVVASLLTIAIGMDSLSIMHVISALLVFAGVYVVTQSKSRALLDAEKDKNSSKNKNFYN